jgi:hypothetical protein
MCDLYVSLCFTSVMILKDHIWIQLNLKHIVKQIYDKHKAIWWQWMNVKEAKTRDDFIK